MSYKKRKHKRRNNKLFLRLAIILFIFFLVSIFSAVAGFAAALSYASKDLSKIANAAKISPAQTSKIYAIGEDGKSHLLTDLYVDQDRIVVPFDQIPEHFRHAVIAVEDERFSEHNGVDFQAIMRALFTDLTKGRAAEGGSTITQQYVKNAFLSREKTIQRKLKEAILAYELEKTYTREKINPKDKVLENYLNTIFFGQSSYGLETASLNYFGKNAKDITLSEGALLAGLIRSPNKYSPYTNSGKATERRNFVLIKMYEQKYITNKQMKEAQAEPLKIIPPKVKNVPAAYFVEYVKQQLIAKYGVNTVFKGGLRIHTSLDLRMQTIAEKSVNEILNRDGDPNASLVAIDPKTGHIKAMVGGKDFKVEKFNLAVQSRRQPGSAFKTFVLASAIENGISVSKTYASSPVRIKLPGKDWTVRNATEGVGGRNMNLREAMVRSVNAVFARLIMDVGADKVVETAKNMGITSPLDPFPAIALGGLRIGVSPFEMASAYGTLANEGLHNNPTGIISITDSAGNVIEKTEQKPKQVISPVTAYLTTEILKGVITGGTGKAASIGRHAAGKTGTTQNYADAWFAGYTPDLSASVWVGHKNSKIPMNNVHGIRVAGGTFPAKIWAAFMKEALKGRPSVDFARPKSGIYQVRICVESNKKAGPFCPEEETYVATFPSKQGPAGVCDIHKEPPPVKVENFKGLTEQAADELAREIGVVLDKKFQVTDGQPNVVISQSPESGQEVKRDSAVTVVITIEKLNYPILQNVVGMNRNQAEKTLAEAGYVVNIATRKVGDPSNVNKVIAQTPKEGTALKPGSNVTIVIGIL